MSLQSVTKRTLVFDGCKYKVSGIFNDDLRVSTYCWPICSASLVTGVIGGAEEV
jgi:hypothetical protein